MARLGPRHSTSDNTSGKSKAEKARAAADRAKVARDAKTRQTSRHATGRADNPPA